MWRPTSWLALQIFFCANYSHWFSQHKSVTSSVQAMKKVAFIVSPGAQQWQEQNEKQLCRRGITQWRVLRDHQEATPWRFSANSVRCLRATPPASEVATRLYRFLLKGTGASTKADPSTVLPMMWMADRAGQEETDDCNKDKRQHDRGGGEGEEADSEESDDTVLARVTKSLHGDDYDAPSESDHRDESAPATSAMRKVGEFIRNVGGNLMEGAFGTRGEFYVAIELALVSFVAIGRVPLLSEFVSFVLGPFLFAMGVIITATGIAEMGGVTFTAWTTPPRGGALITSGVFSQIRHPVYAGNLFALFGFSVWTRSAMRLILTGLYYLLVDIKSRKEEEELVQLYGQEYKSYKEQVRGKFVPESVLSKLSSWW